MRRCKSHSSLYLPQYSIQLLISKNVITFSLITSNKLLHFTLIYQRGYVLYFLGNKKVVMCNPLSLTFLLLIKVTYKMTRAWGSVVVKALRY